MSAKINVGFNKYLVASLIIFGLALISVLNSSVAEAQTFLFKWGTIGSGDGQFSAPTGIDIDSSGNIYVVEFSNNRVQKFTSSGTFLTKWGSFGSGDGQFNSPLGMAVDSSGNVFVADNVNKRIQKFNSSGTFLTKWGSFGNDDGQFNSPVRVAVDSSGNVYVVDSGNHRIQKFTNTGTFITKWGSGGTGDGQFNTASGIAVDSSGNVYVSDTAFNRIQKFTSSGTFLTKWGSFGSDDGQFNFPNRVAINSVGNIYVSDAGNGRIQVFSSGPPPDTTSPSAPGVLTRTTPNSDSTPTFTWTAATDNVGVTSYEVSIDSGAFTNIGNVLTFTIGTAQTNAIHTFGVRVQDAAGNVGPAASISYTINVPPDADLDGVPDATDNCSAEYNPSQLNSDPNGAGNVCDAR